MYERPGVHVTDLDEVRLKRKYVRLEDGKRLRVALPLDQPVREGPPAVAIDEEAEIRIAQQEIAVDAFDVYRSQVFFCGDKVERSVGLIE